MSMDALVQRAERRSRRFVTLVQSLHDLHPEVSQWARHVEDSSDISSATKTSRSRGVGRVARMVSLQSAAVGRMTWPSTISAQEPQVVPESMLSQFVPLLLYHRR